jgi:hypothetical protein
MVLDPRPLPGRQLVEAGRDGLWLPVPFGVPASGAQLANGLPPSSPAGVAHTCPVDDDAP